MGPDYFATIGLPLKAGRWFADRDRADAPGVVIVNEAMARRFWPNQNPIGRRLTHDLVIVPGQQASREVVGVVGDVRHFGLEHSSGPQMFVPHAQMPWPSMAIVLRTPLEAQALSAAVRQAVLKCGRDGARPAASRDAAPARRRGRHARYRRCCLASA